LEPSGAQKVFKLVKDRKRKRNAATKKLGPMFMKKRNSNTHCTQALWDKYLVKIDNTNGKGGESSHRYI